MAVCSSRIKLKPKGLNRTFDVPFKSAVVKQLTHVHAAKQECVCVCMPACVRVCLVGVGVVTSFRVWVGCGMEWQGSADFWGWVFAGVDQY